MKMNWIGGMFRMGIGRKTPVEARNGHVYFGRTRVARQLTAPNASYTARIRDILFKVLPPTDKTLLEQRLRVGDIWPGEYRIETRSLVKGGEERLLVEVKIDNIQHQSCAKERCEYLEDGKYMINRFRNIVVDLINGRFLQLQARAATSEEYPIPKHAEWPHIYGFLVIVTAK
jgi:hypothetical protein